MSRGLIRSQKISGTSQSLKSRFSAPIGALPLATVYLTEALNLNKFSLGCKILNFLNFKYLNTPLNAQLKELLFDYIIAI